VTFILDVDQLSGETRLPNDLNPVERELELYPLNHSLSFIHHPNKRI